MTALSVIYAKFIKPVKAVVKQVDDNKKEITRLEEKITKIKADRIGDNESDGAMFGIVLESLIAVLDGLEQTGANHIVTEQKQKLIAFLAKQAGGK